MERHISTSKPTTQEIIRTILITSITMLVGKSICELTTASLETLPISKNKIIFNCILIFLLILFAILISNVF